MIVANLEVGDPSPRTGVKDRGNVALQPPRHQKEYTIMKIDTSICRVIMTVATVFCLTLVAPEIAIAGEYEDALAVVEDAVGPVGDTNTAGPGSSEWQIQELAIAANQLQSSGNADEALAKILEASKLAQSSQ